MKKMIVLLVVCFLGGIAFAQNVTPKYKVKGDLIEATLYHDNGAVAQTGFYTVDGKLQGEWNSFNLEGDKTATAFYNNGQKVGTWTFYQGESFKKVTYSNAKITEVNTWQKTDTRVVSYKP